MPRSQFALPLLVLALGCGHAAAPAPAPATRESGIASAAEIRTAGGTITPAKVLQRIGVIADDSMGGRNTPSTGLEKTALYLADNYRRWGLLPAGEEGGYFQRYKLDRLRVNNAESYVELNAAGTISRYPFDRWAFTQGPMTGAALTGPIKIISGAVTVKDIEPLTLTGKVVLFVQNPARPTDNVMVGRALLAKAPVAIVNLVSSNADSFRTRVSNGLRDGIATVVAGMPVTGVLRVTMHDSILTGDPNMPNSPNWAQLRLMPTAVITDAPEGVFATVKVASTIVSEVSAPNVVAMVRGSDPVLRDEYVVFSGHMDHVGTAGDGVGGCVAKGTDTICNGADDDGSGTTGVLSIAEALSNLKGRTKRSIVVLNVSGEEKGLLGSAFFAEHPTLPLGKVVADINLDMIGRNNPDSIVVIGKEHSDMGQTLARVQTAHPELHLIAADDIWPAESFYSRSDHFNFARKGVPILFFFNGVHDQYHQADDEVKLIDTSKLSRVAQLAFYLGVEIANTDAKPQWNPDSYQTIVVKQQVPPAVKKP
jgi:hypothetical protein